MPRIAHNEIIEMAPFQIVHFTDEPGFPLSVSILLKVKGPYLNDLRKFFWVFGPPLSAFGTDMQHIIHTTSLTTPALWLPSSQCGHHLSNAPNGILPVILQNANENG